MNFIKKNKFTVIAIGVFLILLILLIQVKNIFFPNAGNAIYGNRLDGIDKVKVSDTVKTEVKNKLKEEATSKVSVRTSGRIVEIIITVNSDVSVETAKEYANKAIEPFSKEQLKYYDFQVFVTKDSDAKEFPIIGYRHHKNDNFVWTKDRTGTE